MYIPMVAVTWFSFEMLEQVYLIISVWQCVYYSLLRGMGDSEVRWIEITLSGLRKFCPSNAEIISPEDATSKKWWVVLSNTSPWRISFIWNEQWAIRLYRLVIIHQLDEVNLNFSRNTISSCSLMGICSCDASSHSHVKD